jgi:hypothetical protein
MTGVDAGKPRWRWSDRATRAWMRPSKPLGFVRRSIDMGDRTTVSGVQKAGDMLGHTAIAAHGFREVFDPAPIPLRNEAHCEG